MDTLPDAIEALLATPKHGTRFEVDLRMWWRWKSPREPFAISVAFERFWRQFPAFRSVVDYRLHCAGLSLFKPQEGGRPSALKIVCDEIEGGLRVHHGYGTLVHAAKIGANFFVSPHVTIGDNNGGLPIIGDNVIVRPHAMIVGPITVGDRVSIGPMSLVTEDVPQDHNVYPSRNIVKPRRGASAAPLGEQIGEFLQSEAGVPLRSDLGAWIQWRGGKVSSLVDELSWFDRLFGVFSEFRSLVDYRIKASAGLKPLAPHLPRAADLHLQTPSIGPRMIIAHGHGSWVFAESIGADFTVNQLVTIGHDGKTGIPRIGDRVTIRTGAVVVGSIHIGSDVVIAPNAFVNFDVPDGARVFPPRAVIVEKRLTQ